MLTLKSYTQITSCTKICPELKNNAVTGHPWIYSGMFFLLHLIRFFSTRKILAPVNLK